MPDPISSHVLDIDYLQKILQQLQVKVHEPMPARADQDDSASVPARAEKDDLTISPAKAGKEDILDYSFLADEFFRNHRTLRLYSIGALIQIYTQSTTL